MAGWLGYCLVSLLVLARFSIRESLLQQHVQCIADQSICPSHDHCRRAATGDEEENVQKWLAGVCPSSVRSGDTSLSIVPNPEI